jgi:hypothetical protein
MESKDHNTLISLREYVDIRFDAQEKAVNAALAAADRAVAKAESSAERRFESVNEFRSTLADSARLLMPRSETEQSLKSLSDKIDSLTARYNARDDERRGSGQNWVLIAAVVAVLANIASVIYYMSRGH